jgi:hypothetical protein
MLSSGSRAFFALKMLLASALFLAGLLVIASKTFLGVVLIALACAVSAQARKARAAHLERQRIAGLWQWAQGLGPRNRHRGMRP